MTPTTNEPEYSYDPEKQIQEINEANAKAVFAPEFIPLFLDVKKEYKLSMNAAIVYGFIRFYTKNSKGRFYFTNEQLAEMLDINTSTVSDCIKKLTESNLICVNRTMRSGGGLIRFVELGKNQFCKIGKSDFPKVGKSNLPKIGKSDFAQLEKPTEIENKINKNNKIRNNIRISNKKTHNISSETSLEKWQEFKTLCVNTPEVLRQRISDTIDVTEFEAELKAFYLYWTEPTKDGKKKRWELQKTFDPFRRFETWMRNNSKWFPEKEKPQVWSGL